MTAIDLVAGVFLGLLGLPADAQPTDVIFTAVWYQDVVEIPEANWAVILKNVSFFSIFGSSALGIVVHALYLFFEENRIDPYFVPVFHFLLVLLTDFIHDSHLFGHVTLHSSWDALLINIDILSRGIIYAILSLLRIRKSKLIKGAAQACWSRLKGFRSATRLVLINSYWLFDRSRFFVAQAFEDG